MSIFRCPHFVSLTNIDNLRHTYAKYNKKRRRNKKNEKVLT